MGKKIELPNKADEMYVCIGVKASNYFMPKNVLSDKGPGGGGWIHFNEYLQVVTKPTEGEKLWGQGCVFAVGDCNYGCLGDPPNFIMNPIPKISYPGEEQAMHAVNNVKKLAKGDKKLMKTWWPWGAGMFATSLGPHDACFVMAATHVKSSGYMVNWWIFAALQKEIIETSKVNEAKDRCVGLLIWHFVPHTPINCWGQGPFLPMSRRKTHCEPACTSWAHRRVRVVVALGGAGTRSKFLASSFVLYSLLSHRPMDSSPPQ